ncbi:hypothetical protein [Neptunomonas antarctica]|uniref:Uncharacterized protein n=1 Tax=Neptunomonas antarctica TaxID=619304 RepID=A0A1N7MY70_9GAMM|nr:hypothetical protein [Neptunomonas antarctica]SIS91030.1 hypothetical protein SAMN05421760_107110 [Neptunomonas antarctica]
MESTRVKINIKTGEIEFEGSEQFVQNQMDNIDTIIDLVCSNIHSPVVKPELSSESTSLITEEDGESIENKDASSEENNFSVPSSFGEWMHRFPENISDHEKALVTAYFVQNQSDKNDFKTLEVNKSLRDHGIKLSNPSQFLKKLEIKKYLFQTRKEGTRVRFMRVSQDGVLHLKTLVR